ncbi:hypothetical protein BDFB_000146 [Asbolus verrucosus]|uniref:EGF-like domain-containing protein n=1 Tax=Asbolus verrucosus TaxID=1661398 RepID=A0A482VTV1_ASBVE|nr:hypothetical protein BDFB_000146 [Asbolus verrucosus]
MVSADCPQNRACINSKCQDPCPGTCGINARCQIVNHNPICSCPANYNNQLLHPPEILVYHLLVDQILNAELLEHKLHVVLRTVALNVLSMPNVQEILHVKTKDVKILVRDLLQLLKDLVIHATHHLVALMPYVKKETVQDLVHVYQNTSEIHTVVADPNVLQIQIVIAAELALTTNLKQKNHRKTLVNRHLADHTVNAVNTFTCEEYYKSLRTFTLRPKFTM